MRTDPEATERKQAELELRESEARYRALVETELELRESEARFRTLAESSPLAIFVNREDKVVLANPACVKLFGASCPEELIGKPALELFDPDSQPLVRERIRVDSEEVPLVEVRIVRLDGTPVDVEATASPFLDQGVKAIQVLLRDITERKQAELELRESEARFRTLAESSPLAIFVNREDKVVLANPACVKLFGASCPEELIGKPALELFDSVSQPLVRERIRVDSEEVPLIEVRVVRLDGTLVDVEATASPFLDQGVKAIQILLRDITERKHAELKRLRAEKFLRETFEHPDVGIAHVNTTDRGYLMVNKRLCEMLGYSREELLATSFDAITHPDDVGESVRHYQMLLASGASSDAIDKRYVRKDGSIIWAHVSVALVRGEEGTPDYMLDVVTDMTERKQAEQQLRESEAKLQTLFELLPVGVSVLDAEDRVTYANPALERILDLPAEGLRNASYRTRTYLDGNGDPLSPDGFASTRAAREGRAVEVVTGIAKEDGQVVWTDVSATPTTISDWRVIVVTADITADKAAAELLARQAEHIERTLTSVIDIAGNIGEMRDPYTAGHQKRVAELAVRIAQDLGMPDPEVADIRVAGLLHDMGKVGVPTEILGKPGLLSPTEFELIKAHAEAGYQLAVSANMEEPIPELIHQHHERCDGSGYPRGLLCDQMLAGAKVLAVADVVEAMVSHRPYRPALGIDAALAEIERGAGSLYDADASKACVSIFRDGGFEFSS